jgi:LuxR family transcriptional regulator, quorum-sensing system regulator BjaR1
MSLALDRPLEQFVFDQIERANAATSETELCAVYAQAFAHFGYGHFLVSEAIGRDGRPSGIHQFGATHAGWRSHYDEQGHVRRDAMIPRVLTTFDPFTWTETAQQPIDESGALVLNEARAFGLRDGFVLPLHYMDGSASGVLLMGEQSEPLDGRRRVALQMLSYYFATIGRRLQMESRQTVPGLIAPPITLTPRQRECLQWVRAGKTDWEIGMILGISEETVGEHVDAARKRLGARTRTQAVIEAISLKLIVL